ncbi:MAG: type II/IV secretion system ATPase subunit, partial [Sulfolobales archaeon]
MKGLIKSFRIRKKSFETEESSIEDLDRKLGGVFNIRSGVSAPEYYGMIEVHYENVKGRILDRYPVHDPWAHIVIVEKEDTKEIIYKIDEVSLTDLEKKIFSRILDYMIWSVGEISPDVNPVYYISHKARQAIDLFRVRLGTTPSVSWSKILYYVERNVLGYDVLDPLIRDPFIEDISCNGVGYPVYVWHRKYESIPTNLWFRSHDSLDKFVMKLAHKSGKHISVAHPILDSILPEGHRIAATYMKEVSTHGSTFTIRKFREDPITIIDLISFKTLTPLLAGYLWFLIDRKSPIMVLGVTGA